MVQREAFQVQSLAFLIYCFHTILGVRFKEPTATDSRPAHAQNTDRLCTCRLMKNNTSQNMNRGRMKYKCCNNKRKRKASRRTGLRGKSNPPIRRASWRLRNPLFRYFGYLYCKPAQRYKTCLPDPYFPPDKNCLRRYSASPALLRNKFHSQKTGRAHPSSNFCNKFPTGCAGSSSPA